MSASDSALAEALRMMTYRAARAQEEVPEALREGVPDRAMGFLLLAADAVDTATVALRRACAAGDQ
jgi:hypothetical protein